MRAGVAKWSIALAGALVMHAGLAAALLIPAPEHEPKAAGFGGVEITLGLGGIGDSDGASGAREAASLAPGGMEAGAIAPEEVGALGDVDQAVAVRQTLESAEEIDASAATPVDVMALAEAARQTAADQPAEIDDVSEAAAVVEISDAGRTIAFDRVDAVERASSIVSPAPPRPDRQARAMAQTARAASEKPLSEPLRAASIEPNAGPRQDPAPAGTGSGAADGLSNVAGGDGATGAANGTPSGNGAQPGGGSGGGNAGAASADYIAMLQAWLERYKEYPRRAKLRGQEGTVLVHLVLDVEGRVLSHRIARSAGHALLDEAVTEMVVRAQPLPRAPEGFDQARLELIVPVDFSLH